LLFNSSSILKLFEINRFEITSTRINVFVFNRNYTVDDIGFYGSTEKERILEKGRFVIVKLFAKKDADDFLPKPVLKGKIRFGLC